MESYTELMDVAKDQSGLSDFGEDTFKEGLEILVNSLNAEARLNGMGEYVMRERVLQHLRQRLEVEDWYHRHPEIDEEAIIAPVIGLSLPRTGSTALTFLLSLDPEYRFLRQWESMQPCPPPATVEAPDPRIETLLEQMRQGGVKAPVPTAVEGPFECGDLMGLDFKSQVFQALAQVPTYATWFADADLSSTYAYEKRVLKLLQWRAPTKTWRLKCPTHLLFLEALDSVFPDAKYVMTHRDPTDVILSVATLYVGLISQFSDEVDKHYIAELNVDQWVKGVQRALAFRENKGDAKFYDIHFKDMQTDPVGQVTGFYDWLGKPVSEEFGAAMQAWWQQNEDTREASSYISAEEFGISLDDVRKQFSDYNARFVDGAKR